MPILNYTSEVPVGKTVDEIHKLLVGGGARSISTTYDSDAKPEAIVFHAPTPLGNRLFRLPPVNVAAVEHLIRVEDTKSHLRKDRARAERVAWRILKDWLEAQLAIIKTEMVSLDEVMLPYMRASAEDERTVYELYVENAMPALPAADG